MRGFCYDVNSTGFNNFLTVPWKDGPEVIEDVRDEAGP